MGSSLRDLPVLLLAVCAMIGRGFAQRPVLDLFGGGATVKAFEVVIGSENSISLVTNPDTDNLISDADGNIESVIATFNGGAKNDEELVVEIDVSLPIQVIIDCSDVNTIRIRVGTGPSSPSNFNFVLAGLMYRYIYNLTSSALSDPERNITITAYDETGPGNTLTALIEPHQPNTDAPVFSQSTYTVTVEENAAVGTVVSHSIQATDPEGRIVAYSLSPSSSTFSIDSVTGDVDIINNTALDFETVTEFELTIVATDQHTVRPLSAEVTLTVVLNNTNDNPPVFDPSLYIFEVPEEATGAEVGTVSAGDADNDDLQYFFESSETENIFAINSDTGLITVRTQLDYESITIYTFNVVASDGENVDTASVVVNVSDIADGSPVISPLQKDILLNLDAGQSEVYLTNGTRGPLRVDDDSPTLEKGVVNITTVSSGVVQQFPLDYGLCVCSPPNPQNCDDVFTLCGTSFSLQQDLFSGATPTPGGPTLVSGVDNVYSFNGRNDLDNNWLLVSDSVKAIFLEQTDNFSISFWLNVVSGSSSAYIISFEMGTERYFSLYESSQQRTIFYYFRDRLALQDDGYNTQVSLSFYYNSEVFPEGLRDSKWHFIMLTVDFPTVSLTVDGYVHYPTRGTYRDTFDNTVDLPQDGSTYDMPAPILTKTTDQIEDIDGYIGGSSRGNTRTFALGGEMRQLVVTDILDTDTYNCLGSCNNRIYSDGSVSDFTTFYNPVRRSFEFSSNAGPEEYTAFLMSLIYSDNGFLPPEEGDESRRIFVQVFNDISGGNIVEIDIVGRSNQFDPILDLNGDQVEGVDFSVSFEEGQDENIQIVSDHSFIADEDLDPEVVNITIRITNSQLSTSQEFLTLAQDPPNALEVTGINTAELIIAAPDPSITLIRDYITALMSVRYSNIADDPVGIDRLIEFTIFDGGRTNDPLASTTVNVITVNDVPVVDLNGDGDGVDGFVEYTEADPPILVASNAVVEDPDSSTLTEAIIEFIAFDGDNESIAVNLSVLPVGSLITCNLSPCNGTRLVLQGAAQQIDYQTLLRTLRYVNLKQPQDLPNMQDRTISVQVNDGAVLSADNTQILIDFLSINPPVIIQLDVSLCSIIHSTASRFVDPATFTASTLTARPTPSAISTTPTPTASSTGDASQDNKGMKYAAAVGGGVVGGFVGGAFITGVFIFVVLRQRMRTKWHATDSSSGSAETQKGHIPISTNLASGNVRASESEMNDIPTGAAMATQEHPYETEFT